MKFNEKLIELRKREGLSQEELGYKLNVTRQTVSKWELGQTTPEMDKLTEMSRIFNVSVDELIGGSEMKFNNNENNTIGNQPIGNQPIQNNSDSNNKLIITIVAIVAAVIVIGAVLFFTIAGNVFNKVFDTFDDVKNIQEEIFDGAQNIIKDVSTQIEKENQENLLNNKKEEINNTIKDNTDKQEQILDDAKDIFEDISSQFKNFGF